MNRYIITFGQIHVHRVNNKTFDKDCVAIVKSETETKAREFAFEAFDNKYHQSIPEEKFDRDGDIKYFPRGKMEAN